MITPDFFRDSFDDVADRQKKYEREFKTNKLIPGLPVIARLDGKAFHTFTRDMKKPFDANLQVCMQKTMERLVDVFCADIGYTQSDEITIIWFNQDTKKEFVFSGNADKIVSISAGYAAVEFNKQVVKYLPEKVGEMPVFDSRVWQLPNMSLVIENLMWRQEDAIRNSITMAASALRTHKELQGVSTKGRLEIMKKCGIDWEDYAPHSKRGVFCKRLTYHVSPDEVSSDIPERYRPTEPYERSKIVTFDILPIKQVGYSKFLRIITSDRMSVLADFDEFSLL